MKTPSNALYLYLKQTGALNGSPEAIALAKRKYRALYKRRWKQQQNQLKEIRFYVSLQQFEAIKVRSSVNGLRTTTYVKKVILCDVDSTTAPNPLLLEALQIISIAINTGAKQYNTNYGQLIHAEQLLLRYLNIT